MTLEEPLPRAVLEVRTSLPLRALKRFGGRELTLELEVFPLTEVLRSK